MSTTIPVCCTARGAPTETFHKAVADANAHLNNAGLPTLHELNDAIVGPPQVIGFDPKGQRQQDYAMGWNAAMEHLFSVMHDTIVAQRVSNDVEQHDN